MVVSKARAAREDRQAGRAQFQQVRHDAVDDDRLRARDERRARGHGADRRMRVVAVHVDDEHVTVDELRQRAIHRDGIGLREFERHRAADDFHVGHLRANVRGPRIPVPGNGRASGS